MRQTQSPLLRLWQLGKDHHLSLIHILNRRLAGGSVDTGTAVSYQVKVTADAGLNCRTAPINGTVTVSYTHLDVYKRQPLRLLQPLRLFL